MELVNEIFGLWNDFAEAGELSIGYGFNEKYKRLKDQVLLLNVSSLQLKEKETITFEDWLIKHSFKRIGNSYVYKKGDSNYDREQLRKLYKMNN